jgi:hypothetical protein
MPNKFAERLASLFSKGAPAKGPAAKVAAPVIAPPSVEMHINAVMASTLPDDVKLAMVKRGHMGQQPAEALAYAVSIRDVCIAGNSKIPAAAYIEVNVPLHVARSNILRQRAEADEAIEIITSQPQPAPGPKLESEQATFDRRRNQTGNR